MRFATIFLCTLFVSSLAFGQTPDPNISRLPDLVSASAIDSGDIDGDSDKDIILISAARISWFENRRDEDGTFGPANEVTRELAGFSGSYGGAAGDFDQDGNIDIVAANTATSSYVLGNGDGTFTNLQPVRLVNASALIGPKVQDMNDDGFPDLVYSVRREGFREIVWLENEFDTSSGFADPESLSDPFSTGVNLFEVPFDVVDVNDDGWRDVVYAAGDSLIWQENRIPAREPMGSIRVIDIAEGSQASFGSLATGDISGNGHPDIVVRSFFGGQPGTRYYPNLTTGGSVSFGTPVIATNQLNDRYAVVDVDADGARDIVIAGNRSLSWVRNELQSSGGFAPVRVISNENTQVADIHAADIGGDAGLDLVVGDRRGRYAITYFEQPGVGNPYAGGITVNRPAEVTVPSHMLTVDIDQDGDLDTFAVDSPTGRVVWYKNEINASGMHGPANVLTDGTPGYRHIAVADVDEDGDTDIIAAGDGVAIIENQSTPSDISFADPAAIASGGRYSDVDIADLNGDAHADIVVTGFDVRRTVFLNSTSAPGTFSFSEAVSPMLDRGATQLVDANNDGRVDIIGHNREGFGVPAEVIVRYNTSSGETLSLSASQTLGTFNRISELSGAVDMDGDGAVDIVGLSDRDVFVFLGDESEADGFAPSTIPFSYTRFVYALALEDMNLDGTIDIVAGQSSVTSWDINTSTPGTLSFDIGGAVTRQYSTAEMEAIHVARLDDDDYPDVLFGGTFNARTVSDAFANLTSLPRPLGGVSWLKNQEEVRLPVELTSFTAAPIDESVLLRWSTVTEQGNDRFEIERSVDGAPFQRVATVDGAGTTTQAQQYAWSDDDLPFEANSTQYRLRQVDVDGDESLSEPVRVELLAQATRLNAPFPNPARNAVTIQLEVSERQPVTVEVFNTLGQRVAQPVRAQEMSGKREVRLSTQNLASGVYFIRLQAGKQLFTERMTVVK